MGIGNEPSPERGRDDAGVSSFLIALSFAAASNTDTRPSASRSIKISALATDMIHFDGIRQ